MKKKRNPPKIVSKYIPKLGKNLAQYSANEMIERVGDEAIKEVVKSVLLGGNIRALTEGLTRKRLTLSNVSLFYAYLQASKNIDKFVENFQTIVSTELRTVKLTTEEKLYLQWMLGLTKKGIQNVLRSDAQTTKKYLAELNESLLDSSKQIKETFGSLSGSIKIGEDSFWVNWNALLQIFTAIGSQTLAIRGAEKSMYGKLFEKLILGSLLTILGFQKIDESDISKKHKVFWLSSRGNKRESDATLLFKPGVGIRFDIGFIGPGNTEISLDKVSRFESLMEHGNQKHNMSTIVIVDRIGKGSRIVEMAQQINGYIVQMSMTNWVKEICDILNQTIDFEHPLLDMNETQALKFISTKMGKIDLQKTIITILLILFSVHHQVGARSFFEVSGELQWSISGGSCAHSLDW